MTFGGHRLMIRLRDGHDMRILDSSLSVTPQVDVRWAFDTFGNSVALLTFHAAADELVIASELTLRRYGFDEPVTRIERHTDAYPFRYDPEDSIDLAPLIPPQCPQDRPAIDRWIAAVMPELPAGSLQVLDLLGGAVHESFLYRRRESYGVQSPAETIASASGSCRDFALLFMEAARSLGFAARFVTGYLYDPRSDAANGEAVSGGGATHAWADIFVPGAGWVEFDPTNRIVAGRNLIRVATTRAPAQAVPVSGSFRHDGATFIGMDVQVSVTRADPGRLGLVAAQGGSDMPQNRASPDKTKTQTSDALDRWDDEGGSIAKPVSEVLVAKIETLKPLEREVLNCLGAAVVVGWNELPTDVQRTLFKLASAEGGIDAASELPARIARFLHDHKDDEGTR